MIYFDTECPDCGNIRISAETVIRFVEFFIYPCPKCSQTVRREMSSQLGELLSQGSVEIVKPPKEFLEDKSGPAISLDDLIDLMLEVNSDSGV
jgi:predicted RNA-binding Zn-ribbon protein involved in translation (DUF1610 family)